MVNDRVWLIIHPAGIPTIIKPFFGDQFFWADRVEALGIGAAVRKLTVDSLADALHEATTNQKLIDRAKLVGEQIRAVRPVDAVNTHCSSLIVSVGERRCNCYRSHLSRHGICPDADQGCCTTQ